MNPTVFITSYNLARQGFTVVCRFHCALAAPAKAGTFRGMAVPCRQQNALFWWTSPSFTQCTRSPDGSITKHGVWMPPPYWLCRIPSPCSHYDAFWHRNRCVDGVFRKEWLAVGISLRGKMQAGDKPQWNLLQNAKIAGLDFIAVVFFFPFFFFFFPFFYFLPIYFWNER